MAIPRRPTAPTQASAPAVRTWRATTAVRVFALSLSFGQAYSSGTAGPATPLLLALVLIAAVSAATEAGLAGRRSPWIPVVEGILAATLLTTSSQRVDALLLYLAVPPIVAGLRHGWVTTANVSLASLTAVLITGVGYRDVGVDAARLASSYPWLAIGLGAGMLAAWQSRSMRRLEESQAPYAMAHHLLAQLHTLAQQGRVGLDSPAVASELAATLSREARASGSLVMLRSPEGVLAPYSRAGDTLDLTDVASSTFSRKQAVVQDRRAALLLRVRDEVFGVLALRRDHGWQQVDLRRLQRSLDAHAMRLETALLFDDVRQMATTEERSRLAREIHDGMAQEMVALGYLVDEIESYCSEPTGQAAATRLRAEIGRILTELRFSIHDLRHELLDQDLPTALSEYLREVDADSGLRVHLMLDRGGPPLPRRTETEILRIAKEAISNARKHSCAINLWVTFVAGEDGFSLLIEDDGVGAARPRHSHYGMHTMRERAEKIGAELIVAERRDGGTVVSLRSTQSPRTEGDLRHEHSSPAGR